MNLMNLPADRQVTTIKLYLRLPAGRQVALFYVLIFYSAFPKLFYKIIAAYEVYDQITSVIPCLCPTFESTISIISYPCANTSEMLSRYGAFSKKIFRCYAALTTPGKSMAIDITPLCGYLSFFSRGAALC